MNTIAARAAVCLAGACLVACDGGRPGAAIPSSGAGATWRWRATTMVVSALSTPLPMSSSQDSMLDVRVAFSDTEGDETKAIGVLTVVVTSAGMQLASTEVPLSDERTHHAHWDSVTETYAVRVPLTGSLEPQPGQTLEVRAVFEGEDGALMRASRDIKWPQRGTASAKRKAKPATGAPSAISSAAEPEQ